MFEGIAGVISGLHSRAMGNVARRTALFACYETHICPLRGIENLSREFHQKKLYTGGLTTTTAFHRVHFWLKYVLKLETSNNFMNI